MNESLSIFSSIKDEAGQKVLAQAREMQIPADTTVFHQGDRCENYLLVLDGSVKVFTRSENAITMCERVSAGKAGFMESPFSL